VAESAITESRGYAPPKMPVPGYNAVVSSQPAQHMQCMEVWGGSQLTSAGVEMGGLDVWVFSKPFGEAQRGGDVYYASSCATGRISRLLLADVSGHGTSVAATAADLRTLMRRFVNRLDQAEFVRLLNQQFIALSQSATFATAVVTTFFAPSRRLTVCNAGHPRPFLYRAAQRQWDFLGEGSPGDTDGGPSKKSKPQNIPLGLLALAEYEQFDVELEPGDCLLSYTDALVESSDADGEMLGESGLLRIMRLIGDVEPQKLIETLLTEIEERYPENLSKDDVTLMLVRASGQQPQHPFKEMVKARFRFAGSVIRGLNPWGERAPLPDLNLANIGGAIVPALARRWRARGTGRRPPTA
jgi:sigma-B regulation protein RsbU (phosphoserine phosphatase)